MKFSSKNRWDQDKFWYKITQDGNRTRAIWGIFHLSGPIHMSCCYKATAVPNQIHSIIFRLNTIAWIWLGMAAAQQWHNTWIGSMAAAQQWHNIWIGSQRQNNMRRGQNLVLKIDWTGANFSTKKPKTGAAQNIFLSERSKKYM